MNKASHWILNIHAKKGMLYFFVLVAILLMVSSFIKTQPVDINRYYRDYQSLKQIDSLNKAMAFESKRKKYKTYPKKAFKKLPQPFYFDANQLDNKGFEKLGFSAKQAFVLVGYRYRIGGFHSLEDFKKCFVVSDFQFNRLKPFIRFGEFKNYRYNKENLKPIELNSASEEELTNLQGIGKVLSKRIVKYRDMLGGFYSVQQLKEVYGITDTVIERNLFRMVIDTNRINPWIIDGQSLHSLPKHPYLSPRNAAKLKEFLMSNPTMGLKDWLNYGLISPSEYHKLRHYVKNESITNEF